MAHRKEQLGLFTQFALCAALTLVVADNVGLSSTSTSQDTTNVRGVGGDQLNGASLEVREAIGEPAPLGTPIQGSRGQNNQNAAGDLQTPRKADSLQPNAGLEDFPEQQQ